MKIDLELEEVYVIRDALNYALDVGLFTKIRKDRPDKQGTLEHLYHDLGVIEREWPAMQARFDRG